MQIDLSYDRGTLAVPVAKDWQPTVIRKPSMPILDDPAAAVRRALAEPVNAPALA